MPKMQFFKNMCSINFSYKGWIEEGFSDLFIFTKRGKKIGWAQTIKGIRPK